MSVGALTAYELFCQRGGRLLFGSLDLSMRHGEAIRITGPNGCGKTSLIRILAGLLPPSPTGLPDGYATIGNVCWDGRVAMLDQKLALDEHLPLGKALSYWEAIDGLADHFSAKVGLEPILDVPVRFLSTGQRKRAAIARLLGQHAENWLLDEPLNGLDSSGVALVEGLVAEHRASGGTVVVASHQPLKVPGAQLVDIPSLPR